MTNMPQTRQNQIQALLPPLPLEEGRGEGRPGMQSPLRLTPQKGDRHLLTSSFTLNPVPFCFLLLLLLFLPGCQSSDLPTQSKPKRIANPKFDYYLYGSQTQPTNDSSGPTSISDGSGSSNGNGTGSGDGNGNGSGSGTGTGSGKGSGRGSTSGSGATGNATGKGSGSHSNLDTGPLLGHGAGSPDNSPNQSPAPTPTSSSIDSNAWAVAANVTTPAPAKPAQPAPTPPVSPIADITPDKRPNIAEEIQSELKGVTVAAPHIDVPDTQPALDKAAPGAPLVGTWTQVDNLGAADFSDGGYRTRSLTFSATGTLIVRSTFDTQNKISAGRRFKWEVSETGSLKLSPTGKNSSATNVELALPGANVTPATLPVPATLKYTVTAEKLTLSGNTYKKN